MDEAPATECSDRTGHRDVRGAARKRLLWRPGGEIGDKPRREGGEAYKGGVTPVAMQGVKEALLEGAKTMLDAGLDNSLLSIGISIHGFPSDIRVGTIRYRGEGDPALPDLRSASTGTSQMRG
jgi:hypothetical protein